MTLKSWTCKTFQYCEILVVFCRKSVTMALFGNSLLTAATAAAAAVGFIWQGNVWLVTKLGTVSIQHIRKVLNIYMIHPF